MAATTHLEYNIDTEDLTVARDFADRIHGKTVLVTGANLEGIGFSTAQAFASGSPAQLILCGRNPSKVQAAIHVLQAEYPRVHYRSLQVDFGRQQSVRAAASLVTVLDQILKVERKPGQETYGVFLEDCQISHRPNRRRCRARMLIFCGLCPTSLWDRRSLGDAVDSM